MIDDRQVGRVWQRLRAKLPAFRGYLALVAGAAGSRVAGFVVAVVVARAVGPARFGEFALFFAVFASFVAATDFVDGTYVMQATRRTGFTATRLLRGALVLKTAVVMLLAVLSYPVAAAFADLLFGQPELRAELVVAVVSGVLLGFVSLRASTFLARERYGTSSVINSVFYVLLLVAVLSYAMGDFGLTTPVVYGIVLVTSLGVSGVCLASLLREAWPPRFDAPVLRRMVSFGKWFIASQVILLVFLRMDLFLLARYSPEVDVGQYGAALRIVAVGILMIGALNGYCLPRVSRTRGSRAALRSYVLEGLVLSGTLCAALLLVWIFSPFVVGVLLGDEFEPAVELTRILLLGVACSAIATPLSVVTAADVVPRHTFFYLVVKVGVLTAAAALLVPTYSAVGAAWAYVISEIAMLAYVTVFVRVRWRAYPELPVAASRVS
jgi:PST family polysaccharide transporter